VRFLADPSLGGRRPRSSGAAAARRYIERQFAACGLVPWGQAEGLSQPFVLGTNVVGVLPGADPNLAHEVVILCAHYDHLGWTRQGLCLGAADNASGVAAMVEIAKDLALAGPRPRRSVCFAAFDLEETFLLGAFAFTCRPDYDPNRVAGVVNLDLLGRSGFEVLDRGLFVVGTEEYPDLRRQIRCLAGDRLEILPVGTDVAGPRGDHVVFEPLDVPVLFFSCGLYKGYHRPGDTADKVDYDDLLGSMQVAGDAVRLLADRPGRFDPVPARCGDLEELEALHLCFQRVAAAPDRLGLTEAERQSVQDLVEKTGQLLQKKDYSLDDRRRFLWWHAAETLMPLVERFESPQEGRKSKPRSQRSLAAERRTFTLLSTEGRGALAQAGRAFVRHASRSKHPFLAGMPPFAYARSWLPDRYLGLTPLDRRNDLLTAARPVLDLKLTWPPVWLWPLLPPSLSGGAGIQWFAAEGTPEELTDVCLLAWGGEEDPNAGMEFWKDTLQCVTGESRLQSYAQWLDWRLAQGPWPDERAWLLDGAGSENRWVVEGLLQRVWQRGPQADAESVTCAVLSDPDRDEWIRDAAIRAVKGRVSGRTLLALASMIDDPRPIPRIVVTKLQDPFLVELFLYLSAQDKKEDEEPVKPRARPRPQKSPATLGERALWKLRDLTGRDFGQDRQAWVRWIERYRD